MCPQTELGNALVIDDDAACSAALEVRLQRFGYDVHVTGDGNEGISWFENNTVDIILVSSGYLDSGDPGIVDRIKLLFSDSFVPIVVVCARQQESKLGDYLESGFDDYIEPDMSDTVLMRRLENLKGMRDMYSMYRLSVHEQEVGKKIHTAAISTRMLEIDPIKSMNRSAGVFSGDLILFARKPGGNIHVMLADFTGHGLSAAIGALPVADTFCVMTEKGFKPEVIIRQINNKLYTLLPTSMFMSMAMIQISPELNSVHVWNNGMPHVYVVDGQGGGIKQTIESSSIPLGVIEHIDDQLKDVSVEVNKGDTFFIHSDGLTECTNTEGQMFGLERLESILVKATSSADLFDRVVSEFDEFYGSQNLIDDVSMVSVPCVDELFIDDVQTENRQSHVKHDHSGRWRWSMELSGASMYDVDPVPLITSEYNSLLKQPVPVMDLHNVLSELYRNAVEYGVFRKSRKRIEREHRCNRDDETNANLLDGCYIKIELEMIEYEGKSAIYIKVEDSGRGFDHAAVMHRIEQGNNDVSMGYGLSLANELCDTLHFNDMGNCVEAVITG